ncbi:MAG: DUF2971 domain-containing protein [Gemmatimonadota bacterium]
MAAPTADNEPRHLYKYASLAGERLKYAERTILHHELFFAARTAFNDPFDCRPRLSLDGTREQIRAYATKTVAKEPGLTANQRKEIVERVVSDRQIREANVAQNIDRRFDVDIGLCCMSACPDDILMWGHYAHSHTGVCLEFDRSQLAAAIGEAHAVHYQSEYPVPRPITHSGDDTFRPTFLTKATPWSYEQEWRLIIWGQGVKAFPPECLTAVIFGARMTTSTQATLAQWAQARVPSVAVKRAHLATHHFGVEIQSEG